MFFLLELCSSVCYHGTCDVECHCSHGSDCVYFNGEYYDEFDVCRSGCDDGWEGIGCQIGNVAEGKETNQTDWIDSRFEGNNSAENCVDGRTSRLENEATCCGVAADSHWEVSLGDVYVVNQLRLHGSDNARFAERVTTILLFRDVQSVVELSTGRGNDPLEITTFQLEREMNINRIVVQNELANYPIRMCEVEAFGYQYKECTEYNSMYYYGPGCLQNCYCQQQCNYRTGECSGICMVGYQHDSDGVCVPCGEGTWGAGCSEQCHCRDQNVCDHVTGICPNGCADVYTGATCQQQSLPTENDVHAVYTPGINEITIDVSLYSNISNYELMSVVLITVLVSVVVVFIIHVRRQTKGNDEKYIERNVTNENGNATKRTNENYKDVSFLSKVLKNLPTHQSIQVQDLGSCIANAKKAGNLSTEYAELPTHDSPTEAGDEQANVPKNRFNNIKPFDHSRIVLENIYNDTGILVIIVIKCASALCKTLQNNG